MSIDLLVERRDNTGLQKISVEEWKQLVERHSDLRIRTEPYTAQNPQTGDVIRIQVGEADAEFLVDAHWVAFLRWRRGRLFTAYGDNFDNELDPVRAKIVVIAKELSAEVYNDSQDDPLGW